MNRDQMMNQNSNSLLYLIAGGAIGAGLALLFAPKSGREMRRDISEVTNSSLEKTRETVDKIRENASGYYETTKDKANELYNAVATKAEAVADDLKALPETAESAISQKVNQISSAVEAGQKEYKSKSSNA